MSDWGLLAARCVICLLSTSILIAANSSGAGVGSRPCTNFNSTTPKSVVFLGFIPECHLSPHAHQPSLNLSRSEARKILEKCDVLVQTAVELAVERINRGLDDIPANTTLQILRLPSDSSVDAQLQPVTNAFKEGEYFGVIGPKSASSAKFWTPVFHELDLLTISYSVTNTASDDIASFYRTLPSSRSANTGRLALMDRNNWLRIASISSKETYYAEEAEDFKRQLIPNNTELALSTSFSDSPTSALNEIMRRRINIIVGFFGPENARKVLCTASSMNLISDDHVWILPSYYNPNWWKQSRSGAMSSCSDEQMRNFLESIIFVDTVKFPSVDESLNEFHEELLPKALDLFPSLTEEDLKPYLLRSRATSAYDAVTLLARSVGVAFDQSEDSCIDTSLIQLALEKGFLLCEYCRLHSGCFLGYGTNMTSHCMELCNPDFTPKLTAKSLAESRAEYLLNSFGQIFYSQFIDGMECPVALLWTSSDGNSSPISNERIYTLEELDEARCAVRLNLSKELFARDGCPTTFQWGDSSEPPISQRPVPQSLPLEDLIAISVLTGVGLVMAVGFIVFNVVWRMDKVVKASSPWLNVILLVGVIIRLPSALLGRLVLSAHEYNFNISICHFKMWLYFLGEAIFLSTLIVKNWRIYSIFNNKSLKIIGNKLTDNHLMLTILLLSLPAVTILIASSYYENHFMHVTIDGQNKDIQISFCTSERVEQLKIAALFYSATLLIILFVLTFLTLRSTVSLSAFHREGRLSYVALAMTLVPIPFLTVVLAIATTEDAFDEDVIHVLLLWVEFALGVLLPALIMMALFLPNIYLVLIKERFERRFSVKKKEVDSLASQDLGSRYHTLQQQSASLKLQLSEANQLIAKLLEEKDAKQDDTSPLTTDSTHSESETKDPASSIHITVYEQTSEHSTHQSDRELHVSPQESKLTHTGTATNSTNIDDAGDSEQCRGTDTGLCITVSDSSNYNCPANQQELNVDRDENTWELEVLDKGSTLGDPTLHVENSDRHEVTNSAIEVINP